MSQRLRLYDVRTSRLPSVLGACATDLPRICQYVNSAQRRLLYAKEAGDEGWYGGFAEVLWNLDPTTPYITCPREIARIEMATICDRAVAVNNPFIQYLQFGNGRLPKLTDQLCTGRPTSIVSRDNGCTFRDLPSAPQLLAVYATNPLDEDGSHRVLLQGLDQNDQVIYSQDGLSRAKGVYVTLNSPFVVSPMTFNRVTGIQKDITAGDVQVFAIDPATGAQTLLAALQPSETTAWYRRYYLDALPARCCEGGTTVQVSAVVKLDLIPALADPDYLLIGNLEAIIDECQAVRYSEMDNPSAMANEAKSHGSAVSRLKGELVHYYGRNFPAVNFAPMGSARLEYLRVGMQ